MALLAAGALTVLVGGGLAWLLAAAAPHLPRLLPGYQTWVANAYDTFGSSLRWFVADTTEAEFFKTALGGVGMIVGAGVAHLAWRRRARWGGFPIAYGSGLFPWVLVAAALGLLGSNIAWGWTIQASGMWQPTFIPFVSVPPAVVLVYGAGWANAM